MPLDIRGDKPEKDENKDRFGGLGKYREGEYGGGNSGDGDATFVRVNPADLPPELAKIADEGLMLVERLIDLYNLMHETDGKEGTAEYAQVLKRVLSDPTLNLLVITAGITALAHMRDAHGGQ